MYSFYFGEKEELAKDDFQFLLSIKRMLPRWMNSLTDSSFSILNNILRENTAPGRAQILETGIGATTLLLVHYAMKFDGHVYSWDMNSSKGSTIRQVIAETLEPFHRKSIADHWTFISSDTTCPHLGVGIIGDLVDELHITHHDSNHTWSVVGGELAGVMPVLGEGAVVCIDDAHQGYEHTYEPIINVGRRKIGLPPVPPMDGNSCAPLYERVPDYLRENFNRVDLLDGLKDADVEDDLYYAWYAADRRNMASVGMEKMNELAGRFVAFRVAGRK